VTPSITKAVDLLLEARAARRALAPLSSLDEGLTVARAYAIQDALRAAMIEQGRRPIGWKLAATGPAGQKLLGVTEPIHGFLFPAIVPAGGDVSLRDFVKAGVEAELAFKMGAPLRGPGVTPASAMAAVRAIAPALEVPDLMFSGTPLATDFIANSAAAGMIVLGNEFIPPPGWDPTGETVTLSQDGKPVAVNEAKELMGGPQGGLALLANRLAERGLGLEAGDIVMSGGISPLLFPSPGQRIGVSFTSLDDLVVGFVA
jgi:2-oxo-3-hexenedioate decarboxylase